jgi:L-alanine-DL-glutamate epimerase-like enolase superfamily enzyme
MVRWELLRYFAGQPAAEGFVLRLQDDAGNTGLGEARAISGFGSGPTVLKAFLARPENITALLHSLQQDSHTALDTIPAEALFAAETAMHDLAARATGQDLTSWLGYPPRTSLANSLLVSDEEQARQLAEQGHRNFKFKAHGDSPVWLSLFEVLRTATQGQARIRVDANQSWDLDTAERLLGQVALENLAFVEQPFPVGDLDNCVRLKNALGVTIAIDEGAGDKESIEEIAARNAADLVVIKPMFRGLAGAMDLAATAEANSLGVCITHSMDGTIGRLAAMHIAATIDGPWPHGLFAPGLPELAGEPRLEPDLLLMPTGPGLGWGALQDDLLEPWGGDS